VRLSLLALVLVSAACASTAEVGACTSRPLSMSLAEAHQVVSRFEAMQASVSRNDPLSAPKSAADVLEILKRDQIDLFSAGITYAAMQPDQPESLALQAQLELAWGDAQQILADIFTTSSERLLPAVRALELRAAADDLDPAGLRKLSELKDQIGEARLTAEALGRLASEHVATGASLAKRVIAANPNDYVGYRVVADYYRLRQNWDLFSDTVTRIEETKPDSNGLVFLRGTAAMYRDGNLAEARSQFQTALARDPGFTRAQAQLVLASGSSKEARAALEKLREINPTHQMVIWAGPVIQAAEESHGLARMMTGQK
jgi:tetratricopeptide (TPR) repeat protein